MDRSLRARVLCLLAVTLGAVSLGGLGGCATTDRETLVGPRTLTSPYAPESGEVVWAVAPLRNESGASFADTAALSDKLVAAAEGVQGIRAVPLNRTIAAMRALEMPGVRSPADARRLAQALGVDAVIVGSLTAYDPYTPTIGLALALYPRPGAMAGAAPALRPRELGVSPSDGAPPTPGPAPRSPDDPRSTASLILDAKNHQVQMDVRSFAEGRIKGESALGWRRYMASMDLYSEFAAFRGIEDLVRQEWVRGAFAQPGLRADGKTDGMDAGGRAR